MTKETLRILIIAFYFPPLNKIASLRPYAWAKYWSKMGHEVTVLTATKEDYEGYLNLEIGSDELKSVRIEEVPYFSPRRYIGQLEGGKGGGRDYGVRDSGRAKLKRFLRDNLRRVTGMDPSSPHFWVSPAVRRAHSLFREWPFDVVVSTYGPPACHIIGSRVRDSLPVFWVADYRDLWHGSSLYSGKWPFSLFEKSIEDHYVRRADLITTVSDEWKEILSARFGNRAVTIENGFDVEDMEKSEGKPIFPRDGRIRLIYTGTLYIDRQDPEPLFKAVSGLRLGGIPIEKKMEIIFYGVKRVYLQKLIDRYGLGDVVAVPGLVERKIVLRAQRQADMLIFLDWIDPSFRGMLTGKIYEYLYSGTPVLCIGTDPDSAAGRLIREGGFGLFCDMSGRVIADVIEGLLKGEKPAYTPSEEMLNRYTRENLSKRMLEEILRRFGKSDRKPG